MAAGGQKSKIGQILPHKSHFGSSFGSCSSDLDQIWQVDTTQPKEQVYGRIFDLSQNPRWPPQPPLRQITKKSIKLRDPIFFPRPMFSRVRNAMKLSFAFYDLSNYLKIQNGRHFWDFTPIREALYFFPRPMFSRVRNFCGSFKLTCQLFTRLLKS